jgi:hypothetical protein
MEAARMTMNVAGVGASGAAWPDVTRRVPAVGSPDLADKAGANPSGDLESSLRVAALRRDAAPAAAANAPALQTTAEQLALQRSVFTTPTSLAVTTAIAAYAAAAATAPPRATPSPGASAPAARREEEPDRPPPHSAPRGAHRGGYNSRA